MIDIDYYFLANVLPPLQVEMAPELSFVDFCDLLDENLKPQDRRPVEVVRLYYDIQNLRSLWLRQPLDERGNFSELELDEAILEREGLPDYVYDFIDRYDDDADKVARFGQLVQQYFLEEIAQAEGFLQEYLCFEREWRLVLLGFRAKQQGRDIAVELQYEDPYDPIVAQLMAQKDAKSFEPPARYEELKSLFEQRQDDPFELYKGLCEYRMRKVQEMIEAEQFSIDFILGYMVQLIIVERWLELDRQQGQEIVESIVKGTP